MKISLLLLFLLASLEGISQVMVVVSGRVSDATSGQNVFGAWVRARTTYYATATNPTGGFQVRAKPNGVLVVSHPDYKTQKIKISGLRNFDIKLQPNKKPRQGSPTDSTQNAPPLTPYLLTSNFFNGGLVVNPLQALTGQIPGLVVSRQGSNPDQNPTALVRGMGSLLAGNEPLYVLDGVPNVPIDQLPIEDIASVELLRGAAASRYGMRGANGVLLIKTKKATPGTTSVEYRSSMGVETMARQPDLLNADEFRAQARKLNIAFDDNGANTDWVAAVTRPAFNLNQYLAFGKHTEQFNYRASFSYLKQQGNFKLVDNERLTGQISATQTLLNQRLTIGFNLALTSLTRHHTPDSVFYYFLRLARPTDPIFNPDGSYFELPERRLPLNPVAYGESITHQSRRFDALGNLLATYQFNPHLRLQFNSAWRLQNQDVAYYQGQQTPYNSSLKGDARRTNNSQSERYLELNAAYDRTFQKHQVSATGGYAFQELTNQGFAAANTNFISDALLFHNLGAGVGLGNTDPRFPFYRGGVSSYQNVARVVSFFGQLDYTFNQQYFLSASLRRDGSSKLAPSRKWGNFGAVSAGWHLHQTNWLKNRSFLHALTLRANYGLSGNIDGVPTNRSQELMDALREQTYFDGATNVWMPIYGTVQAPNPTLQWEQTRSTGVGLDFAFKNLRGSLDWYNRLSTGVLWTAFPPFGGGAFNSGTQRLLYNTANIQNKGVELALEATIANKKHFKWQLNWAMATQHNKLLTLDDNELNVTNPNPVLFKSRYITSFKADLGVLANALIPDQPVGALWGANTTGLDERGFFKYPNNMDWFSKRVVLGNPHPSLTMGITNRLTYRRWQLSFLLNGRFGNQLFNMNRPLTNAGFVPGENILRSSLDSPVGGGVNPDLNSYWIEDGRFLRLDNLQLQYDCPLRQKDRKLRIFVSGNNLFLWTKYSGIDPEQNLGTLRGGVEHNQFFYKSRGFNAGWQWVF
ncbi:MAG: SusC/RagA family TonB-linked outer membrane protein [Runella slithyformis]|nr:MAG: SusC/RagA family TonB-linked outer membrane protein [Runella slithyformis]TAF28314.1 MAG: SusC/RagA family TonB-linked outer membrane protein [Runella slithyformis]TAF49728.1 MAG: SusC/RagA family TonB-linked outer membrane protein [Runella slithyformis]TAF81914.1 MAG: SusC/RagA family TonB-linked outer membrane protein [Runella slithyformis]